jgi:hypothetical protein
MTKMGNKVLASRKVTIPGGGGAIEIACNSVDGGEMLERDPGRYVAKLPPGAKITNRNIHSYELATR